MNIKHFVLSLAFLLITPAIGLHAGQRENAVAEAIISYLPGNTVVGKIRVECVLINAEKRRISVKCNENASYIPLTNESLAQLKSAIKTALGKQYKNYDVTITADGCNLDGLVLFARKEMAGPSETVPFITRHESQAAPKGLDGSNIALWQSHGWYFEPKLNRWEWQRARIFQTVEDLYTQSYVMPFLMPMLQNAGAYVMSPRERDTNLTEIIIDRDSATTPGYSEHNGSEKWGDASTMGFAWDGQALTGYQNPFRQGKARSIKTSGDNLSTASWTADIPNDGEYAIYVSYTSEPTSASDARYTVNAANGQYHFTINQNMGGGTWIYLGHFYLNKGANQAIVELSNLSEDKNAVVTADAVKIGGGTNIVARIVKEPLDDINYQYVRSGYPKFTEAARYFMQWAGVPDSIYSPSDHTNDYTDDYKARGEWVNWLSGGSSVNPHQEGLNIPIDLSFAFHTDAGTFRGDTIVGTLSIYSTLGDTLGNGLTRNISRDLTELISANIVDDIRATFEPNWTRRAMWDKTYYEARGPKVPAMLLELLSHQNFADMKYGLDPKFRFVVSRAIYKGMLKFLAYRDSREYVVQPLPVKDFAIAKTDESRTYRLSWAETVDSLETTATPTHYIVEQRIGDALGFTKLCEVNKPELEVTISDTNIHSYRIIAANDGGVSFPSETLALCDLNNGKEHVMIVNGFTRVSAPDWFEASEDIAGFYDQRDHGVPYINDISFIGSQFEYRRDIPWMDDDAAGFGASRADYEDKVIAGNTFDYVYTHGKAIAAAGHSFISSSVAAYMASPVDDEPEIVDLILGKQKEIKHGRGVYGTYFKTYPKALQEKITVATASGTSFFISGAFVATDLWDNIHSDETAAKVDQKFATDILGYHWRVGQASVTGEAYEVPCRFREFTGGIYEFNAELNDKCYIVESPDSFYPADDKIACTMMRYGENNLIGGIAADFSSYRTVVIGFPFETINSESAREQLITQILDFFSNK